MTPFDDRDAAVSHPPKLTDTVDRLRVPSHHISNGAMYAGNGIQHNGHNNIETSNQHTNTGTVNYIQNNYYNSPTDSPTQSHEPIQHPEGSCEHCKILQKQCEILQKECEILQEQCETLQSYVRRRKSSAKSYKSSVRRWKSSAKSYKSSVRRCKSSAKSYKSSVRSYKSSARPYKVVWKPNDGFWL